MNFLGEVYLDEVIDDTKAKRKLKEFGIKSLRKLWEHFNLNTGEHFEATLQHLCQVDLFEKGHQFNKVEDNFYEMYFIVDGFVKVYDAKDTSQLVLMLNEGNPFLSHATHLFEKPSFFKYVAGSNIIVLHFTKDDVATLLKDPKLGPEFMKFIAIFASYTAGFLSSLIAILKYETAEKIKLFRNRFPGLNQNISAKTIAEFLNMNSATYSRTIQEIDK